MLGHFISSKCLKCVDRVNHIIPGTNLDTEMTVEVFVALYGAMHQFYLYLV